LSSALSGCPRIVWFRCGFDFIMPVGVHSISAISTFVTLQIIWLSPCATSSPPTFVGGGVPIFLPLLGRYHKHPGHPSLIPSGYHLEWGDTLTENWATGSHYLQNLGLGFKLPHCNNYFLQTLQNCIKGLSFKCLILLFFVFCFSIVVFVVVSTFAFLLRLVALLFVALLHLLSHLTLLAPSTLSYSQSCVLLLCCLSVVICFLF